MGGDMKKVGGWLIAGIGLVGSVFLVSVSWPLLTDFLFWETNSTEELDLLGTLVRLSGGLLLCVSWVMLGLLSAGVLPSSSAIARAIFLILCLGLVLFLFGDPLVRTAVGTKRQKAQKTKPEVLNEQLHREGLLNTD